MSNGLDDRRMWPSLVEELCVAFPITDPVERRTWPSLVEELCVAFPLTVSTRTSLQDVSSTTTTVSTRAPLQGAPMSTRTSLQDVSLTSTTRRRWNTHSSLRKNIVDEIRDPH